MPCTVVPAEFTDGQVWPPSVERRIVPPVPETNTWSGPVAHTLSKSVVTSLVTGEKLRAPSLEWRMVPPLPTTYASLPDFQAEVSFTLVPLGTGFHVSPASSDRTIVP